MTSEELYDPNFEQPIYDTTTDHQTARLKQVKSADVPNQTTGTPSNSRGRKKNRFKFKERSASSVRDQFYDDPAFTKDIRHLALPMRRNSGPENELNYKIYSSKIEMQQTASLKRKQQQTSNASNESIGGSGGSKTKSTLRKKINVEESSSSENLDMLRRSRRGQSLDRYGEQIEVLKRTNWFQRDSSNASKRDKSKTRISDQQQQQQQQQQQHEYHETSRSSRSKNKNVHKQNFSMDGGQSQKPLQIETPANLYKSDNTLNSTTTKPIKDSKFQIGKRFLKGEIGIKSFNYYLIKEGLRSSKKNLLKQKSDPIPMMTAQINEKSKSDENIYEEIFFSNDKPIRNAASLSQNQLKSSTSVQSINRYYGPPPMTTSAASHYSDCELCLTQQQNCNSDNCDLCKYNSYSSSRSNSSFRERRDSINKYHHPQSMINDNGAKIKLSNHHPPPTPHPHATIEEVAIHQQNVLQFQSYNPNNPGVYKIETTPVAFTSDYNPIQQIQHYNSAGIYNQSPGIYEKIRGKSSSSNDSLNKKKSVSSSTKKSSTSNDGGYISCPKEIYKTDSHVSLTSDYSMRSENSNHRYQRPSDMSDSSLGDSMFSYSNNHKRYFGSAESCRFTFDNCRRCSYDGEKCSFSDTCRYEECNRNCDCSSSYFSSDFDDNNTNNYNNYNPHIHTNINTKNYSSSGKKANYYADDFIKHLNNVKKNNLYQTIPCHRERHYEEIDQVKQEAKLIKRLASPKKNPDQKTPPPVGSYSKITKKSDKKDKKFGTLPKTSSSGRDDGKVRSTEKLAESKFFSLKLPKLTTPEREKKLLEATQSTPKRSTSSITGTIPKITSTQPPESSTPIKTKPNIPELSIEANVETSGEEIIPLPTIDNSLEPVTSPKDNNKDKIEVPQPRRRPSLKDIDWDEVDEGDDEVFVLETEKTHPNSRKRASGLAVNSSSPLPPITTPSTVSTSSATTTSPSTANTVIDTTILTKVESPTVPPTNHITIIQNNNINSESCITVSSNKNDHHNNIPADVAAAAPGAAVVVTVADAPPNDDCCSNSNSSNTGVRMPPILNNGVDDGDDSSIGTNNNTSKKEQQMNESQHGHNNNDVKNMSGGNITNTNNDDCDTITEDDDSVFLRDDRDKNNKKRRKSSAKSNEETKTEKKQTTSGNNNNVVGQHGVVVDGGGGNNKIVDESTAAAAREKPENEQKIHSPQTKFSQPSNEFSCATDVPGDTWTRDQENPTKYQSTKTILSAPNITITNYPHQHQGDLKGSNNSLNLDKSEIIDFPLPAIPVKKSKRNSIKTTKPHSHDQQLIPPALPTKTANSNRQTRGGEYDGNLSTSRSSHSSSLDRTHKRGRSEDQNLHKMHYRNSHDKPTYLFGENIPRPSVKNPSEIILNKSGWVQVNQGDNQMIATNKLNNNNINNNRPYQYAKVTSAYIPTPTRPLRVENYNKNINYAQLHQQQQNILNAKAARQQLVKSNSNKIENYVARGGDGRKIIQYKSEDQYYGRPGYLPVKHAKDRDSPPPITPILSPPPAFQDTKAKLRQSDSHLASSNVHISVTDYENRNPKGMVFSRSFEYDNRRNNVEFNEIFSKSFDYDFKTNIILPENRNITGRQKSMTFSTLTGISPNYLTKRESFEKGLVPSRSRDNSPLQSKNFLNKADSLQTPPRSNYLDASIVYSRSIKPEPIISTSKKFTNYRSLDENNLIGRSRRAEFSRIHRESSNSSSDCAKGFRSLDAAAAMRLNSCDSGARSDFSNDEDEEEEEEEEQSLALSYKSTQQLIIASPESHRSIARYQSNIPYSSSTSHIIMQKQRSLTPEKVYDDDDPNILSSHSSLIKQRSLTPEKRSLTPEEKLIMSRSRSRIKNIDPIGSNPALMTAKHYVAANSRSSTLERHQKQQRYVEEEIMRRPPSSRSSSSSSYEEHENPNYAPKRAQIRPVSRNNAEHKIRRSRSLQLTERSPNRSTIPHKVVVRLGGNIQQNERIQYGHLTQSSQDSLRPKHRSPNEMHYQVPKSIYLAAEQQQQQQQRMEHDKSRSFDIDYDQYHHQYSPNDYEKSRSFDDEYYNDPNSNQYGCGNEKKYSNNLTVAGNNQILYAANRPELMYDVIRRRSPVPVERPQMISRSREVSPNNRQMYHHRQTMNDRNIYRDKSPVDENLIYKREFNSPENYIIHGREMSSPGSDFDGNLPDFDVEYDIDTNLVDDELIKEAELVTEFLYGKKYKPTDAYVINNQGRDNNMRGDHHRVAIDPRIVDSRGMMVGRTIQAQAAVNPNSNCNSSSHNRKIVPPAGTPSSGSCTASSCDFWPHCGISNINPRTVAAQSSNTKSNNNNNNNNSHNNNNNSNNHTDTQHIHNNSQNNSCNTSEREYDHNYEIQDAPPTRTTINEEDLRKIIKIGSSGLGGSSGGGDDNRVKLAINPKLSSKPPISSATLAERPKTNQTSIVFLGECEMPITKKRDYKIHSSSSREDDPANSLSSSREIVPQNIKDKIEVRGIGFAADSSRKFSHSLLRRQKVLMENWSYAKYRSQSLPKSFLRESCSSTDDATLCNLFVPNSPLQMRTVSSPTLSENPIEITQHIQKVQEKAAIERNNQLKKPKSGTATTPVDSTSNILGQHHNESVLQKFKKTFSHFKGKPTTVLETAAPSKPYTSNDSEENTKHRFGPLVWRSSKERRKTKHYRRDKCNSGDSGIQVELENDEFNNDGSDSVDHSPSVNIRVRRANSAKISNSALVREKLATKEGHNTPNRTASPPIRSLSQSSGLDRIAQDVHDDSDSESASSQIDYPIYAEVLYPFEPAGQQELRLEKGLLIEVMRRESGPWWWGQVKYDDVGVKTGGDDKNSSKVDSTNSKREGWFPKEFVRVIPPFPEAHNAAIKLNGKSPADKKICDSLLESNNSNNSKNVNDRCTMKRPDILSPSYQMSSSSQQVRDNIIRELLETEINYVKLLSSLCLGFVNEMRLRSDLFTNDMINLIFSNIEKIWRFQQTFVDALKTAIETNRIAECFLEFQSAFMVYSTYCNCYPRALAELEGICLNKDILGFLESCRINESLPELPLSAHLLAPIQRICRYPLHLIELVKHSATKQEIFESQSTHHDGSMKSFDDSVDCKETFEQALNAMKRVTEMVNEGKRHSEYLSRVQSRFDNFQGPPINVLSSRLFLQTDAIRVTPNLWNNAYTLFLFDRQLIYCKKDILKRTQFMYKGRIYLDNCRILNLPDGKIFGVSLKHALRIYCDTRNKWFDFCFRSSSSKMRFLNTLSAERQYCGESLFVSEIENGNEFENLSEREYNYEDNENTSYDNEYGSTVEKPSSLDTNKVIMKSEQMKYSDTLPKNKTRKIAKDINYEYSTSSLGRKKLGNWFRKAKSTNSTPNHSPTHHPLSLTAATSNTMGGNNTDSSSQSSPTTNKILKVTGDSGTSTTMSTAAAATS